MKPIRFNGQVIAAVVGGHREIKIKYSKRVIDRISENTFNTLNNREECFEKALVELSKAREFLSNPNRILGSELTKHGEIAENLEVNIRNAYAVLSGHERVATFEGINRTAPADYKINGVLYQSKFYNDNSRTIAAIGTHLKKYSDLQMNYIIPKDQFKMVEDIKNGVEVEGLKLSTAVNLKKKIEAAESELGSDYSVIMRPSLFEYKDVQIGKASETLGKHSEQIIDTHYREIEEIKKEDTFKKAEVAKKALPSVSEGLKVSGLVTVGSGAVSAVRLIHEKVKGGKKLQEFNSSDWSEIGLKSGKTGAKAGVAAGAIYSLTNLTSLSAPFAGAFTSATIGVSSLMSDFKQDLITAEEFFSMGHILCLEAGIAVTGGAIGQTLIPIPGLGGIIGRTTANILWSYSKGKLGEKEEELKNIMDDYTNSIMECIEEEYREILDKIELTYEHYNSLIDAAFDIHANTAVLAAASVEMALEVGVPEHKILKSDTDLDAYFLN